MSESRVADRYEGLRIADFEKEVVATLRSDFEKEIGAYATRPSARLYQRWVTEAGGSILGIDGSDSADEPGCVVPLWLLKASNTEQMGKLFQLIGTLPSCILHYLENTVFPAHTSHQATKLSASGQELGASALFGKRLGFSGTPSDLLPVDLGRCGYEKGSDGHMMHVLTCPAIMDVLPVPDGWGVEALLKMVATASTPRFAALIDVGALITGYTNAAVAALLLEIGLGDWAAGVVFLDENDEKQIHVRATGRVVPLSQCGIPVEARFVFYDQIHTTGMDIKHAPNARAALTVGKDMVFRDLAQGAFRMRGIGAGQTVTLLVVPEVCELVGRQLGKATYAPDGRRASPVQQELYAISAWLAVNACRSESVQFNMSMQQSMQTLWRANAFDHLMAEHRSIAHVEGTGFLTGLLDSDLVDSRGVVVSGTEALAAAKPVLLLFSTIEMVTRDDDLFTAGVLKRQSKIISNRKAVVIWIPTSHTSQVKFTEAMAYLGPGFLAVPPSHSQRRQQLLSYFRLTAAGEACVVLSAGCQHLITTRGRTIIRMIGDLMAVNSIEDDLKFNTATRQRHMNADCMEVRRQELAVVQPRRERVVKAAERLHALDVREVDALAEILHDADAHHAETAALQTAMQEISSTKGALGLLTSADLSHMAETTHPSACLKAAVEAACIVIGYSPDFQSAQVRLMHPPENFVRKAVDRKPTDVAAACESRLHACTYQQTSDRTTGP